MTAVIGGLFASRLQRDELVATVDEGHRPALATQLKVEDAAVECQRLLDIPTSSATWFKPTARGFVEPTIQPSYCRSQRIW
jgi:hypothetical protein